MSFKLFSPSRGLTAVVMFFLPLSSSLYANTPSEMAEFSLLELFDLSLEEVSTPWQVSLLYKQMRLEGYQQGSDKLTLDEVLFDGREQRTARNFPIVPTVIFQEAIVTNVSYNLDRANQLAISIPFIKQDTDHISIIPSYDKFNISSSGVGDISVSYSRLVEKWGDQHLSYSFGVSLPTGSITQHGDTPRSPGNQQLPYTMQLGSGTWDLPISLSYQHYGKAWYVGTDLFAKLRLGRNNRDYRLGNRLSLAVWTKWPLSNEIQPFMKLSYQRWGAIKGQDDELLVTAKFIYPAGITNPKYYGGKKLNAIFGSELQLNESQQLNFEIAIPLYQHLNGVQPKERLNASINWNIRF